MSKAKKKVDFIKSWYTKECSNLSFSDKLKLARVWIEICLKDEEYEMAAVINNEKHKIIKQHIKDKRSKRSFLQKLVIFLYLKNRKIRAFWIRNKR
jgi:hypothetical protein